jgi:hypothetical protein
MCESMFVMLVHEAAAWWRRCAPGWAPPLEAMIERDAVAVRREGTVLRGDSRNATYRVLGLPEAWMVVAVAVAAQTRAAKQAGVASFPGRVGA